MQGQDIHVPFGKHGGLVLGDTPARLSQPVKMLALFVNGRIAAVYVFRLILISDNSAAERNGFA